MTIYNNMRSNMRAEADLELAEYGIIRTAAKKGLSGDKNKFFTVTQEGPGEGAELNFGSPDELSEYGTTMYMVAPDDNSSMNMLHREKVETPFFGMSNSDLRNAMGRILDSI